MTATIPLSASTGPTTTPVQAWTHAAVPLPRAVAWFADATHLPAWTGFFLEVAPATADGRHAATTLAGPITTWTTTTSRPGGAEVSICSLVGGVVERATLRLTGAGDERTQIEFIVRLLEADEQNAKDQSVRMNSELAMAKRLLEVET